MDGESTTEPVDQIREVFSYLERFKGCLFVFKIDYAIVDHPLFPLLIRDLVRLHRLGIRIVLVAGARQRIDDILAVYGITSSSVKTVRISSPEAMPFIKMAAFDAATRVMTLLSGASVSAVIGNWVRARSLGVVDGVDYQNSGTVDKIRVDLVERALSEGLVPIFPCIGWNALGDPYNLSSNELARSLSIELKAEKLFFVTDSGGIEETGYLLPETVTRDASGRISRLDLDQAAALLELNRSGAEGASWYELLSHAYATCRAGVKRVHVVDGRIEGVVLKEVFTSLGSGTMVYANEFERIRPMRTEDIPDVLRIMQPFIRSGTLVPRDEHTLERQSRDYVVYELDGAAHGCGSLHLYPGGFGEIAAVAVDHGFVQLGIGNRIVSYLMDKARRDGVEKLFLLTTGASDWFLQLGFVPGELSMLPEEKRRSYDRARNSRIMIAFLAGGGR